MHPVMVLLMLSMCGVTLLGLSRNNSVWEAVGAVLTIAPVLAIPVGYAMGTFT